MIRSILFKNLGLKILSLCVAMVLWYSVVSERQTNLLVTVPLTFVNVPKGMKVRTVSAERVSLHLEGPVSSLRTMEIGKIRGTIDLKGSKEGKSRFELSPAHFNLPEGIRIAGISPEIVYVVLEKLLTFKLPVKPRLKGRVDSHYAIRKIYAIPKFVWVIGDRKAMSSISNIPTEVVTIDGLKKNLKKTVALEIPRDIHLKESLEHVEVHVILREKVWDKEFDGVALKVDQPSEGYSYTFDPSTIKVVVRGWATMVDALSPDDFKGIIPVKELKVGLHEVKPRIEAPEGVKVLSVMPDKVRVIVSEQVKE
ncbi:MAG: hypothetical protein DSY91_07160 [Deltaproteobacteria bacterium]|nr:MAG: hypothetical protein DSY91_07160 [Deltaproteobacteria bacterium]